jgi:hypothetical protein
MRADSSDRTGQVFQSLWLGARLSPLEHLCVKSFLAHGHRFVLYSYDQVDNVPPGTVVEDARAILPADDVFRHDLGSHAGQAGGFSDRFRYELLRARGGWWIDTDVLCLKSEIPETPYVFAREAEHGYNGAVLKAPRDSVFLSRALARTAEAGSGKASSAIHQALEVDLGVGPQLVTELVRELGLESEAWAREDLYAVSWDEALTFLDPAKADSIEARLASSTFVHFWNTMLRLANVHKDVRPPEGSYLDRAYAGYDVDFPAHPRYEWAEIEPQYVLEKAHWATYGEVESLRAELRTERERATARRPRWRFADSLARFLPRSRS